MTTRARLPIALLPFAAVIGLSTFQSLDLPETRSAFQGVPTSQFTNFESAHVHPIDMTPDGTKLLAVNTANNSLEVFNVTASGLVHHASIPVGLDPVTVRARTNTEAWVVCQVSDEVSIVDLALKATVRTVLTENEPADVVFAGSPLKAFVSCAEQEMVQVFNLSNLAAAPTNVLLKGEQPRALAVSPDGSTVYCAFFESGNQTTVLNGNAFHASGFCSPQGGCTTVANDVTNPAGPYGGVVPVPNAGTGFNPPMNPNNPPMQANHSLVVRKNAAGQWMDDNGGNWTALVSGTAPGKARVAGWDMPDRDVAMINANSPSTATVTYKQTLGNILMAMSVRPTTGEVFVVGTDATNEVRFEPNLKGKFLRVNVSRFAPAGTPVITDLNPHINYTTHSSPLPVRKQSIGDPRAIVWKSDGSKAYVAGMGSNNLITINSLGARLAPNSIAVGEGPTGIVLDETNGRAYVLNRFEGSISVVDLSTDAETGRMSFFDPTPLPIKKGRKHLYNTHLGSGHGHIACGSCHVDSRWDRLAWDLGNPAGDMVTVNDPAGNKTFHPMKGLKTTQFLIDIINRGTGKLHWRGDKAGFHDFAGAFVDLQGADAEPSPAAMQEFSDFLAATWYVPNPYRTIRPDTSWIPATVERMTNRVRLTGTTFQTIPQAGVRLFVAVNANCSHCHQTGSGRGHLPGNGSTAGTGSPPIVNMALNTNMTPDLRSTYRKNGFFYNTTECTSGFGMMSDGVMETLFNQGGTGQYLGDYEPELLSWSGGITQVNSPQSHTFDLVHPVQDALPAVGMRMTVNGSVGVPSRVTTLRNWVDKYPTDYALIVKGVYNGQLRGFYYLGGGNYQPDENGAAPVAHTALMTHAQAGNPLTWTVVHPNTKIRHGVDRDADGIFDFTDGEVELALSLQLEGAFTGTTMRTDLVAGSLLPASDPYLMGETVAAVTFERTGPSAPVDWVLVELRSAVNNSTVVQALPAIVQANGRVVRADGSQPLVFFDAPPGQYHVAVRHRNHLGAMTFATYPFGQQVQQLDFGNGALATWGTDARKVSGSTYLLWAGNVNGDGLLRYTGPGNDRDPILVRIGGAVPTATVNGYWAEDVNLDGVVRYSGGANDRDPILVNIGGSVPTNTRVQQLP
ncbi:MAG: beta-propeller fold lactonase family protein [Flavobacteriales bacterium]|nr:beta-propeller fold lactonase family protein [Flavobacteriales bacterium]